MGDIKQFLYAWCGKKKVSPTYEFSQTGAKHKPRFKCEVLIEGHGYVAVGNSTNKKDAQANAACAMVQYLVREGEIPQSEVPALAKNFRIKGLVAATFSPFDKTGELNLNGIDDHCAHLLSSGITQVFINGGTGEGPSLTLDERKRLAEKWIAVGKDKLTCIVVHVGALNLKDTTELAKHAAVVGADAIASLPPLYFKPTNVDQLTEYCQHVAEAAPSVPFYYYHIPPTSNVHLNMEEFLMNAKEKIPTLRGIKYSSPDLVDMIGCTQMDEGRFNILYGCDNQLLAGLVTGADGAVGNTYNYMPGVYVRMMEALERGDMETARREQWRSQKANDLIDNCKNPKFGNSVGTTKYTMSLLGLDLGPLRQPVSTVDASDLEGLRQDLENIGFFSWCK